MAEATPQEVLERLVFIRGENRPFGELTLEDVRQRAAELRSTVGWGPTARVAPIARAWAELANELERAGLRQVSEVPAEMVVQMSSKLWINL